MDGFIFAAGLFVFLLSIGGLIVTVVEFRRMGAAERVRQGERRGVSE